MAMPASSGSTLLTAEELEVVRLPDKRTELVRGQLVVRELRSTEYGRIQATLTYFVTDHVRRNGLGHVFGQDTGFRIESSPDTVRGPDLAFVRQERAGEIPRHGYAALAPDLVVEILSPEDRPAEYLAKVAQWLGAGTLLVWVIDSQRAEAHIHRADGSLTIVRGDEALDGEAVLPGFSCPLVDILR